MYFYDFYDTMTPTHAKQNIVKYCDLSCLSLINAMKLQNVELENVITFLCLSNMQLFHDKIKCLIN